METCPCGKIIEQPDLKIKDDYICPDCQSKYDRIYKLLDENLNKAHKKYDTLSFVKLKLDDHIKKLCEKYKVSESDFYEYLTYKL